MASISVPRRKSSTRRRSPPKTNRRTFNHSVFHFIRFLSFEKPYTVHPLFTGAQLLPLPLLPLSIVFITPDLLTYPSHACIGVSFSFFYVQ